MRADLESKVASPPPASSGVTKRRAPCATARRSWRRGSLPSRCERSWRKRRSPDRDIRLRALGERADKAEAALAVEQQSSRAARAEVEQLGSHRRAARTACQDRPRRWSCQRPKPRSSRARSPIWAPPQYRAGEQGAGAGALPFEFFGRLREIIGDRADIHIVGDRFVSNRKSCSPPAVPSSASRPRPSSIR